MNSMVSSVLNTPLFAEALATLKGHLGAFKEKALESQPICGPWALGTAALPAGIGQSGRWPWRFQGAGYLPLLSP